MKLLFLLAAMVFPVFAPAADVSERLLDAIAEVESGSNDRVLGDGGKAAGRFQLWTIYVDEVNRICVLRKLGRNFSAEERTEPEKAREMVRIYLEYWGFRYEKDTGRPADDRVLAWIHNGHAFWKRSRLKNPGYFRRLELYWEKIGKELESSRRN